jgi:hypothetical protein
MSLLRIALGTLLIIILGLSATSLTYYTWISATPDIPPENIAKYEKYAHISFIISLISLASGGYLLLTGLFPQMKIPPPYWADKGKSNSERGPAPDKLDQR